MMSLEEIKALRALVNIKDHINRAKETGIGLCHAGIFSDEVEDYLEDDADADDVDEKDESESE